MFDCGMLFKLEKVAFDQSKTGDDRDPMAPSSQIKSVPVKPSDFHRVRLRLHDTTRAYDALTGQEGDVEGFIKSQRPDDLSSVIQFNHSTAAHTGPHKPPDVPTPM
jgi:hypothetical protein